LGSVTKIIRKLGSSWQQKPAEPTIFFWSLDAGGPAPNSLSLELKPASGCERLDKGFAKPPGEAATSRGLVGSGNYELFVAECFNIGLVLFSSRRSLVLEELLSTQEENDYPCEILRNPSPRL
jgi:hypothetical protein